MTDKDKTIKELKEALDSLDVTSKYRLTLIRAIEYLQEEPVSEDLEEAAKRYATEGDEISGLYVIDELLYAFKAGANWQKQKDESYTKSMYKVGINTGKELMKQQMMKEAVEVPIEEAVPFGSCKWKLCAKLWLDKGVKGNKVKLVIIKDE